nr:integrase, catalytic region, zinc finger, CCHC-type, peptidase aspartic, catalytic [Tanacetum cinerariifolium]
MDGILDDGASWSIDVDMGELAISTAHGAAATGTVETAIVGGFKYSSNKSWNKVSQSSLFSGLQGMFKLDLEPLSPKLLNNKEAHIDYLKTTKEQADILRGIVKQAKAKQPLDSALDFSCKAFTDVGYRWKPIGRTFTLDDSKDYGIGEYQLGNITISRVYYVKGLGHNLFSVRQCCDSDLEVAFRKHTCHICDLDGCTTLVEVTLVKGHEVPSKVKVLPMGFHLYPTSVNALPVGSMAFLCGSSSSLDFSTIGVSTVDQDAPSPSTSQTPQESPSYVIPPGAEEADLDIDVAHIDNDPYFGFLILESSKESSSQVVIPENVHLIIQQPEHISKWTKDIRLII